MSLKFLISGFGDVPLFLRFRISLFLFKRAKETILLCHMLGVLFLNVPIGCYYFITPSRFYLKTKNYFVSELEKTRLCERKD